MPRFTPEFLDEIKARLPPSDVIGRYVKLQKRGNAWWGLSPFNKEKTPSFTVNDQRGSYHCFSSQNHGDIITFLMETQGLSFPEAVEQLAADAGLEVPAESPGEAARAEQAKSLADACGAAADYFAAMLHRADGREALQYLNDREVSSEQIEAFSLGFAPNNRTALKDHLLNKGYKEETLIDAGLVIKPDDGGASYDRFRGRIMFPILGARERVIAFGGRALDPNARAKYLNSPETALFHKGSVLYNYLPARAAAAKENAPLIVCEGYMDVIALWGAGIKRAVAPLGTALTEDQLALLWRASDEPILCFDGDKAGVAAAHRSIDRAMPLLKPGKSLRFSFLPEGKDPDDLIRTEGPGAFHAGLENAEPLARVLWAREIESRSLDTPERRAALRTHLRDLVKAIADKDVRAAYGAEFARRLDDFFAAPKKEWQSKPRHSPRRKPSGGIFTNYTPPARPSAGLKRRGAPSDWANEATLVLAAINHPALIERQEAAILDLELGDPALKALLSEILSAFSANPALDSDGLKSHLSQTRANGALERVLKDAELSKQRFLRPNAGIDEVEQGFKTALAVHLHDSSLKQDVTRSASQIFTDGEEGWKAAMTARESAVNDSKVEDGGAHDDSEEKSLSGALENWKQSVEKKFSGR